MNGCAVDPRFAAIGRVYGVAGLEVVAGMHVCVIGLGGVGSWAVEGLARSGVGRLTLIDDDKVCPTNINRQIHALDSTLGQSKVAAMAERIGQINPGCQVESIHGFLTLRTLEPYLAPAYDYVIDAIDSIQFKAALIDHCRQRGRPLITTGGAGGMSDPTKITVADLSRTYHDPLASRVRARLRQAYGFPREPEKRFGVECVFSTEQPVYPQADGSVSHRKPGLHGVSLDCRFGYGSISTVTAVFGFVAAARAINRTLARRLATAAPSPRV
jgi:tRNA threonylcarbamoyladenosine dehydratase